MLCSCRINPKMLAYTALEEEYNYLHNSLIPLKVKVIAFNHYTTRQTQAPHGTYGLTISYAMNHYRCIKVYVPKTNGIIIADTFQWSQDNAFQLPTTSNEEQLATVAYNLANAIKNE